MILRNLVRNLGDVTKSRAIHSGPAWMAPCMSVQYWHTGVAENNDLFQVNGDNSRGRNWRLIVYFNPYILVL